ncbi:TetR/AcrR family transcriptional regulator [Metabacillus endolithicus]|uniref:TetR/AcrR family transcriptional regulator n=1 Tax=Metabacillus endolithicus TaxID=1535204 RepID=A0ABW5C6U8_9BACI|nr:TetR/AcrR family transcriptional regulator [Metabacillus endolithicus]UPG63930.1 TetR/AcrR family transcriptional regulator [Metabacillus endolithicus]
MNERKIRVIKKAHQLFIEKGFQATSIQDILEFSNISKGTFYNYFSSKNELLIAIFSSIYKRIEEERSSLLIGKDPADLEIFIDQVKLHMEINRKNNLLKLLEEVTFIKDEELNQAIKKGQWLTIRWTYKRFIELYGKEKQPFLLDCAIMFLGILQQNMRYYSLAYESNRDYDFVVRYSVERMKSIVDEVSERQEQLFNPELVETLIGDKNNSKYSEELLIQTISDLKKIIQAVKNHEKYTELLEFIQEEITEAKHPRQHLIAISLDNIKANEQIAQTEELQTLEKFIKGT